MKNKINNKLLQVLLKNRKIQVDDFLKLLDEGECIDNIDTVLILINSNGLPLYQKDDYIYINTNDIDFKNQEICFIDIETNGSKPDNAQIIEIAGIKVKNMKIIDSFSSLVYASKIPKHITKITNITPSLVKDAPKIQEVLREFKIFLGDSIFVAHGLNFDYDFISFYMQKYALGELLNQKICTLRFAKKMIKSQKYSISHFNEYLEINKENMHRAYDDACVSYKLFSHCFDLIEEEIKSTNDLVRFIG